MLRAADPPTRAPSSSRCCGTNGIVPRVWQTVHPALTAHWSIPASSSLEFSRWRPSPPRGQFAGTFLPTPTRDRPSVRATCDLSPARASPPAAQQILIARNAASPPSQPKLFFLRRVHSHLRYSAGHSPGLARYRKAVKSCPLAESNPRYIAQEPAMEALNPESAMSKCQAICSSPGALLAWGLEPVPTSGISRSCTPNLPFSQP